MPLALIEKASNPSFIQSFVSLDLKDTPLKSISIDSKIEVFPEPFLPRIKLTPSVNLNNSSLNNLNFFKWSLVKAIRASWA